ncbi:MAG: hypothetical protein MJ002_05660 [Paludibacteraceae bacterium]|nr:hypothetical protein [Paludibacteraceae bacterium]
MDIKLNDTLSALSGRIERNGKSQLISRIFNGKQQIYTLTPSSLPRSTTQKANSSKFRRAVSITYDIYHNPDLKAAWLYLFSLQPRTNTSLYNFILSHISRLSIPRLSENNAL